MSRPRGRHLDPGQTRLNRDAVLLDEVGASPIEVQATGGGLGGLGTVLDLGGRLNKTDTRVTHRYLMTVPQTAELIANLVVAAQTAARDFGEQLEQAIAAEQERVIQESR